MENKYSGCFLSDLVSGIAHLRSWNATLTTGVIMTPANH